MRGSQIRDTTFIRDFLRAALLLVKSSGVREMKAALVEIFSAVG
jgi:hypothetical protein